MSFLTLPFTFTGGTKAIAAQIDACLAAIEGVINGKLDDTNFASANKDGATGLASLRTLGVGTLQAAQGSLMPVKASVLGSTTGPVEPGAEGGITVTHGLGFTPSAVFPVIVLGGSIAADIYLGAVSERTSTTFVVLFLNKSGSTLSGSVQIQFQAYR